jgi:hypothetical protein
VGAWFGLVAGEMVMETIARRDETLAHAAARFHRWLDLCAEIPLFSAVVLSGTLLLARATPDVNLWIKVACGLLAVAANAICVAPVLSRARLAAAGAPAEALLTGTRWVFGTATAGLPFGLAALYLGGQRFSWW